MVITQNGANKIVVQDHDSHLRTRDVLMMLKPIAMGESDVAKGRTIPRDEVFSSQKSD